jgi:hypothetical protein
MRDFKTSKYQKTIGISLEMMEKIERIKGKKSKAGKLDEIILFYLESKNL